MASSPAHTHTRLVSLLSTVQTQEVRLYHGDQTGYRSRNSKAESIIPVHFLTQISISPLTRLHPHTHTHTELGILSVPISHLDSERTCHLQLMVCHPTQRGTSFINPLNCESQSEGMQHITNIPYG